MIPRDPPGRYFRKSIVNDYVRNKKLPRDISAFLFVGRMVRGEYHFVDIEYCGNVSRTYG